MDLKGLFDALYFARMDKVNFYCVTISNLPAYGKGDPEVQADTAFALEVRMSFVVKLRV